MSKTLVINLFGGPGCGKSTLAAEIFAELKERGYNAELVTEFAKDLTWEDRQKALACQEYVFGNQSWRMARLKDKVDFIVTDSPLPLSIIYNKTLIPLDNAVMYAYEKYNNINIFIIRDEEKYQTSGRSQSLSEAIDIDDEILELMDDEMRYEKIYFYNHDKRQLPSLINKCIDMFEKVNERGIYDPYYKSALYYFDHELECWEEFDNIYEANDLYK